MSNNQARENGMFNLIAPVYGLFYKRQKKRFDAVLDEMQEIMNFSEYKNILDVGCGTGVLCDLLSKRGLAVTGIDSARKMLDIAIKRHRDSDIEFVLASALKRFPFEAKSFDISIASYVAHGLTATERKIMYEHMSEVTKKLIIIYDYNDKRGAFTNFIERLEGGDYFNFIKFAEEEMKNQFSEVKVFDVGPRAAWYLCVPNGNGQD